MNIQREEFLTKLQQVTPGLSTREIIDQSSCFVFTGKTLATFNDDVACRLAMKTDFVGAVQAAPLLDILRKLTEETIDISFTKVEDGHQLIMKGKHKRIGIRMEAEIALPVNTVERPEQWKTLPLEFSEAISIVKECAGRDETHFHLTCIHIHPKWVEACDGFQISRYKLASGIEKPFLVRKESLKHIVSLNMLEFSETPAWVHFKNDTGLILSCRRYLEEYQDMSGILKVEGHPVQLPKGLVEAVQKATVFSSQSTEDNMVLIQIRDGKLKLTGEGVNGWYEEIKAIKYTGEPMKFLISPILLGQLVQKHNECQIGNKRLCVTGKNFRYVTSLGEV
jgi:DNA polymerase III sliding clamp (beta) subunit (PCNA family)